ncbi:NAD(P)-dependent oxidoreductase [Jannaschia sp. M317]|uniref:NAD-dependent epimerase/dehydratase family protein n=1 Tax=Jannaschia sp. M317 TaxID=2867011 RepID=UPI0021A2EADF|nr:NAD(P)-dependent oxidoreductase [Jannaschia sp. M317]UWQ19675.1 NAD(P)-dependent oxidoreductase [Jannaschia sp. M317]
MKVAVTGANGFLGHHILAGLKADHDMVALQRRVSPDGPADIEVRETDYGTASLSDVLKDCDAVIHLAAQRMHGGNEAAVLENAALDHRLFSAAHDCGVRHVIFASTRGLYGTLPAPWHETDPIAPDTTYAMVKGQSELSADFFTRRKGLPVTALRLAQVFGLGEYDRSVTTVFLRNGFRGQALKLSATGLRREYIYVKDVVGAMRAVLERGTPGVFNLGSGTAITIEEMAAGICAAFGRPGNYSIAEGAARLDEHSLMDISHLTETFGWTPSYSLEEAIRDIAATLQVPEMVSRYGF